MVSSVLTGDIRCIFQRKPNYSGMLRGWMYLHQSLGCFYCFMGKERSTQNVFVFGICLDCLTLLPKNPQLFFFSAIVKNQIYFL